MTRARNPSFLQETESHESPKGGVFPARVVPSSRKYSPLSVISETHVCVNEGSREFVMSLFRGLVSDESYVEVREVTP